MILAACRGNHASAAVDIQKIAASRKHVPCKRQGRCVCAGATSVRNLNKSSWELSCVPVHLAERLSQKSKTIQVRPFAHQLARSPRRMTITTGRDWMIRIQISASLQICKMSRIFFKKKETSRTSCRKTNKNFLSSRFVPCVDKSTLSDTAAFSQLRLSNCGLEA